MCDFGFCIAQSLSGSSWGLLSANPAHSDFCRQTGTVDQPAGWSDASSAWCFGADGKKSGISARSVRRWAAGRDALVLQPAGQRSAVEKHGAGKGTCTHQCTYLWAFLFVYERSFARWAQDRGCLLQGKYWHIWRDPFWMCAKSQTSIVGNRTVGQYRKICRLVGLYWPDAYIMGISGNATLSI